MHAGYPMIENTIALMQQYPQVYAETGVLQTVMTTEGYETLLKQFIDAGLGKRLMYGTDQMIWPSMIDHSLDLVEKTKVMTREEKRDFLYNNAVRFFRLEE
jgi:predicted TIM-barrel fold metal-dependent hydrolase